MLTQLNPATAVDSVTALLVHPATDLFPPVTDGSDFEALVEDIKVNGLQRPIVRTLRGAILDGRRRAIACQRLGITPKYRVYTGDPWRFVVAVNDHRFTSNNHRAMVGGSIATNPAARLGGRQVTELCGVSSMASMLRGKAVIRTGTERLKTLTTADRVPLTTASRIAELPVDAQDTFCDRIEHGAHHRTAGRPGWTGDNNTPQQRLSQREARYRYVQESALQVMANSLDGLAIVLASADGLDPAITSEQAAQWRRDLSRQSKSFRQLMALLSERGAATGSVSNAHHHDNARGADPSENHGRPEVHRRDN